MTVAEKNLPDLALLEAAGVPLPQEPACVYLSGSFASGMAHAASDFDIFVVTKQPFTPDDPTGIGHSSVKPHEYPIVIRELAEGRCDIEYWLEDQVKGMIEMFAPGNSTLGFTIEDVDFLYRLSIARPLSSPGWLACRQDALAASEFASMVAQRSFGTADSLFEDALGMLEAGDTYSAVLAAHEGFGRAVDGLLAIHRQYSPRRKWRAQKLKLAQPELLSLEEFWRLETMRDLHPDQPTDWVREVIERSRELMMEVEI